MKKIAEEIIYDYYMLTLSVNPSKKEHAKQAALDMIQRRIDTIDIDEDYRDYWFEVKQEMLLLL